MHDIQTLIKTSSFINGNWYDTVSKKKFNVLNPATGEVIAAVTDLSRDEIRETIDLAHKAMPGWAGITGKERASVLHKWFQLVLQHREILARIMTMECGKPLTESLGEVAYGASFIEWFAEEAKRIYGDVIPGHMAGKRLMTIKQAIGVAAAITPWNFPLAMITRKAAPAMAAGCAIIVKPAEATPLTALALAQLAHEAGIPPGVLNVVTTNNSSMAGKEFSENLKVRKVSFTGSTRVGRILLEQCAGTIKKVSLELGGTSPFIIFEDADIDAAVKGVIASKYRNAGQTCVCANLILVQEKLYDDFIIKLKSAVEKLKMGNGLENGVTIGPLINESGLIKVKQLVEDALEKGAKCITGGKSSHDLFFEPTILKDIKPGMRIVTEEIFGPVAPVLKFKTEDEALTIANSSEYGLAAYFYSKDISRCWRVAEALEYGMVGINEGVISTEVAPFGGVKQSGLGREGSKYGIEEYTETKYMCYGNI